MNDPSWVCFEEAVQEALDRNGLADPGDALRVFLWLLRERHRAAVTARASRAYCEDFELPDPRAGTVTERIKDLTASLACKHRRDPEGERPCHDSMVSHTPESISSVLEAIANVLHELIPLWDLEAMDDAAAAARPPRFYSHALRVAGRQCPSAPQGVGDRGRE